MRLNQKHKGFHSRRHLQWHRMGLFLIVFGVIGGGLLLYRTQAAIPFVSNPPHEALCLTHSSATFVRPGASFPVTVRMQNTGDSTWSPSYGFFLSEYSNAATSGVTTWKNVNGATFTGSTGPGAIRQFSLTVTAPTTPGVYGMNWGMHIVFQGFVRNACTNRNITVKNPPAVSLNLNGQPSNISVTQGAGLTVGWTASNGATSCAATGNWSGAKNPPPGSTENRTADTSSVGTKTYSLQCSNEVGAGTRVSRTVVVNAPPASPPPSSGSPVPATPRPRSSSGTPVPAITTDTSPPSTPTNFQATYSDSAANLRWDEASDNSGVRGYELERSMDQTQWERLGEVITEEVYIDTDVNFDTTYFYRLRAIDDAGNASPNATTQITTGGFEPNIKAGDELVLTSDDGVATATIPSGALDAVASCDLVSSEYLAPNLEGYSSVTGPYELLCKLANGDRITVFTKPVTVHINLSDSQKKQYGDLKFYTHSDDWDEVTDVSEENSFELGESTDFAVLGKINKTPLWQKLLIGLLIILAIIGAGLVGLTRLYRWRLRKQIERQNQDSYNKERGY